MSEARTQFDRQHSPTQGDVPWIVCLSRATGELVSASEAVLVGRGGAQLSFTGFIHDREALIQALELSHRATDAAIVLGAYQHWGLAGLRRLRGAFAVAIVDRTNRVSTVARDPAGLHPLFYAERGSDVVFASHPKVLIAHAGVSRTLNRVALADHLCLRWPDPQETFFDSIRRVMPGTRADLGAGSLSFTRYWNPVPNLESVDWLTTPEAVAFDERLDRAVDRCLSCGPTGIFLSGGIDSVSVAAIAADRARARQLPTPRALSLIFPDPECNESDVQRSVARSLDLPHVLLNFWDAVGPRRLLLSGMDLNRDLGAPLLNTWQPAYNTLALRGQADGVRVILTGSGGDEWLTVSPYLSADKLAKGDVRGALRLTAASWRSYRRSLPGHMRNLLWKFGVRPLIGRTMHRMVPSLWERGRILRVLRNDPSWIAPDKALRAAQLSRIRASFVDLDPPGGLYLREVAQALTHKVVTWEMEEQYEIGKRLGVRILHPYWDPDLVDALFRSQPALLNAGGRSKGLVRRSLAARFPQLGFERQRKVHASTFYKHALQGDGARAFAGVGKSFEALGDLGIIDPVRTARLVNASPDGDRKQLRVAWILINMESWVRANC